MSNKFREPILNDKSLELRYENNVVCIYGTQDGLKKLSDLILDLIKNPGQQHIHIEDYQILTKKSLNGAIAIFEE